MKRANLGYKVQTAEHHPWPVSVAAGVDDSCPQSILRVKTRTEKRKSQSASSNALLCARDAEGDQASEVDRRESFEMHCVNPASCAKHGERDRASEADRMENLMRRRSAVILLTLREQDFGVWKDSQVEDGTMPLSFVRAIKKAQSAQPTTSA
ncbi:unnamed protein product [Zymoseptoria tritici ST99CH_3D7]|uniref:Uncharacterized protein n=1 Tax=Zymoseptoria tritici (strain ST99CH_3D7) TaxID=1276538 RepID=A0A1X7RZ60_ZYMT9|nr:unnamed protein product [Zymoseptoria tritici ST99CH_3D7]